MSRPDRTSTTQNWIGTVVAFAVLFSALGVLSISVVVPRLTGSTPYSILSGSMRPGLDPGDLIVVRPTEPDRIGIGTVISYQIESGEPAIATHRVVALTHVDGERRFRTRGDANESADDGWVRPVQIKGVVWYQAPHLGRLHSALTGTQRQAAVHVVAGCLLAYAAAMFAGTWLDRRRRLRVEIT